MTEELASNSPDDVDLSSHKPVEYSHTHIMVALTGLSHDVKSAVQTAADRYKDLAVLTERVNILEQRGYIPPEDVITKIVESEARFNDKLTALASVTKGEIDKIKDKLLPILGGLALIGLLAGIGTTVLIFALDKIIPDAAAVRANTTPHNTPSK